MPERIHNQAATFPMVMIRVVKCMTKSQISLQARLIELCD